MVRSKLDEHRLKDVPLEDVRARPETSRPARSRIELVKMAHSIPDAFAVALDLRARHHARHRRLQVRPDPGGRRAGRRLAARRARPRGPAAAVRRLHQRRPPRHVAVRVERRAAARAGLRALRRPDRGHLLRLEHPPRPAGGGRRRRARPQGLAGGPLDAQEREHRARRSATSTSPRACSSGAKEIEDFPDHKLVVISTGSQGEPLSALRRMAHGDHPHVDAPRGRHGDLLRHADPRQRARGERDDRPHLPPRRGRDHHRGTRRSTPRATATPRSSS